MRRTNIYLEDDQLRALKHLAVEDQERVAVLIRRAVDEFLARRFHDEAKWGERFDALVRRIQSRIPAGVSPEQIEADITGARDEVRQARRVARAATSARGR